MQVESAIGLVPPVYLVIDPDVPEKREWIRVNTINGNNLENLVRNLDGSVGDVDHEARAKVRAVFTMQFQDDVFADIEDLETGLYNHKIDTGDPHANAGYVKESEGDVRYLRLAGGAMSGNIDMANAYSVRQLTTPTADGDATPKLYVDVEIAAGVSTHAAITDAHHAKYTDAEAVAAVGTPWVGQYLPLHGTADAAAKWATARTLTVQLAGDLSGSASASLDGTANKTITVTGVVANDSHTHDTRYYTESESDGRFAAKSHTHSYLPLSGGTLTGVLHLPAGVDGGTSLRFGVMGDGDGMYGNNEEFSIAMAGSRHLTVWSPTKAAERDTGVIEIRGGGTSPYVFAGDHAGVGFKLTATALKWLADEHN